MPLSESTIKLSTAFQDPQWDRFLIGTSRGQYQQSSAWGRTKAEDGWQVLRCSVAARNSSEIHGGFQILWKRKGPLRIGYISKGPVVADAAQISLAEMIPLAERVSRKRGLSALILQPPDCGSPWPEGENLGWMKPKRLDSVISASVWVDLTGSLTEIERRISKNVLRQVRKTRASDLSFRLARESEYTTFFDLMVETCRRQGVQPNPNSARAVGALLSAFQTGSPDTRRLDAQVLFAEAKGIVHAATLLIRFGDRLTELKKGWSKHSQKDISPNKTLVHEGLVQAQARGARYYDFAGISRETAERLLGGASISDLNISGPDEFKLHFGGKPQLLPEARLWTPYRTARLAFAVYSRAKGWFGK